MMNEFFHKFAEKASDLAGAPWAFLAASLTIVAWAASGPFLEFSNTWQLIINTVTTMVTFLMVFLIQNTQNRESKAVQLKLDELIRVAKAARKGFIDLEDLSDEGLARQKHEFERIRQEQPKSESLGTGA